MFPQRNLNTTFRNEINEKGEEYARAFIENYCENSFVVRFPTTPQQICKLNEVYAPIHFISELGGRLKTARDHLIPSVGMDIAEELIRSKLTPDTMAIGPRFNTISQYTHACFDFEGRDEMRVRKGTLMELEGGQEFLLNRKTTKDQICYFGAQKCSYKARHAVMNNVYDISQEDMCVIFEKHQLSVCHAYMMLPAEVTFRCQKGINEYGYTIKYVKGFKDSHFVMTFATGALSYKHNAKIWHDWCTRSAVVHNGIGLVFERTAHFGPFTEITITRVMRPIRTHLYIKPPDDWVQIYDFTKDHYWLTFLAEAKGLGKKWCREELRRHAPKYVIKRNLWDRLMQQAICRPDENFTRQNVALHIKATISRVTVSNEVLMEGYEMSAEMFSCLIVSIFINAAALRQEQTRTIGKTFDILKGKESMGFFNRKVKEILFRLVPIDAQNFIWNEVFGKSLGWKDLAAQRMAYLIQVRDIECETESEIKGYRTGIFKPRLRNDDWIARTTDGCCVQETKALLRDGTRRTRNLYSDEPDFSGDEELQVELKENHCMPILHPKSYCDHDNGYQINLHFDELETNKDLVKIYDRYVHDPIIDTNVTTETKFEKFLSMCTPNSLGMKLVTSLRLIPHVKKDFAMICGSPGNDLVSGIGAVNLTTYDTERIKNFASMHNVTIYENRNICCDKCLEDFSSYGYYYCDLGMDADRVTRLSTQIVALSKLVGLARSNGKVFCLKIQGFLESYCLSCPGINILLEIIGKYNLYCYNVGNANEIFVHNRSPTIASKTIEYLGGNFLTRKFYHQREHGPVLTCENAPRDWQDVQTIGTQTLDEEDEQTEGEEPAQQNDVETYVRTKEDKDKVALRKRMRMDNDNTDPDVYDLFHIPESKLGVVIPYSTEHVGMPEYRDYLCEDPVNTALKTKILTDVCIVSADCEKDEELIQRTLNSGIDVIRRSPHYCQRCAINRVIAADTSSIQGNEIIHGVLHKNDTKFGKVQFTVKMELQQKLLEEFIKEMKANKEEEYAEVNKQCIKFMSELTCDRETFEVYGMTGCPGSGKTTTACRLIPEDTCVISPYRRLCDDYDSKGFKSKTFIKGLLKRNKAIMLDEVYAFHPGLVIAYLYSSPVVYVIGDPRQMTHVSTIKVAKPVYTKDVIPWKRFPELKISHTLPVDTTLFLNKYYGYDIKTTSKVLVSMRQCSKLDRDNNYLCFTTAHERINKKARTVAKVQGMRMQEVNLMIEPNSHKLVREAHGQFVVAVSRHSEKLNVFSKGAVYDLFSQPMGTQHTCKPRGLDTYYTNHGKINIQRMNLKEKTTGGDVMELFKVTKDEDNAIVIPQIVPVLQSQMDLFVHNETIDATHQVKDEIDIIDERKSYVQGTDYSVVNDIVGKLAPTIHKDQNFYGVTTHIFDNRGSFSVNNPEALANERERFVRRFNVPMYGRPTFMNSASQTMHCAFTRYVRANYRKRMSKVAKGRLAADLFEVFMDKVVKEIRPVTKSDLNVSFAEFMEKMNCKNTKFNVSMLGDDMKYAWARIDGFLKQQNKADVNVESWIRYSENNFKAGQGIAAQSKAVNFVAAAYIRAFAKRLRESLNDGVYLVNGLSEEEIDNAIAKSLKQDYKGISIDVKECDTIHDSVSRIFMNKVYRSFGIPQEIVDLIEGLNLHWVLDYDIRDPEFPIRMLFQVHDKLQSGKPDTLEKNTLVVLCMVLRIVSGVEFIMSKGDDVVAYGENLKVVGEEKCFKMDYSVPLSFVGYLIGDKLTLDLPRMCVKLLNRNYPDLKSIMDYQIAVKDWLRVFHTEEDKIYCASLNSKHYDISIGEAEYMVEFLFEFANGMILNKDNQGILIKQHLAPFCIQHDAPTLLNHPPGAMAICP